LIGKAEAAMHDVHDIEDNACNHLELEQRIEMLNEDQKRVFEKITNHLNYLIVENVNVINLHHCKCLYLV